MDSEVKSEVFNMDCLEYMKTLPDNCFDLCIADPPYGIGAGKMTMGSGKNKKWKKKDWDSSIPKDVVFDEILRTCKNVVIWGGIISICQKRKVGLFGIKA